MLLDILNNKEYLILGVAEGQKHGSVHVHTREGSK